MNICVWFYHLKKSYGYEYFHKCIYVYGERDWRENRWRVLMIADQEIMIGMEEIWWTSVYLVNGMVGLLMKGD